MRNLKNGLLKTGLAFAAISGIASAQTPPTPPPATPAGGQQGNVQVDIKPGDIPGPIDSLADLQDTGRMVFKVADTNNDGQISKKEAIDAGNLMVGGFFFRADTNGDGALSQDEAKQAREALYRQQPLLRYVIEKGRYEAKNAGADKTATDPAGTLATMLDTNNDKQVQASEVRQAVTSAVDGVFALADTNRDNMLSPTEINSSIVGMARTVALSAFQQADTDKNGSLSKAEYNKAIIEPANVVFGIFDGNNDGQISQQEAEQARALIANQLKMLMVPEPANSARNLLRNGTTPDQVAPVPGSPARR